MEARTRRLESDASTVQEAAHLAAAVGDHGFVVDTVDRAGPASAAAGLMKAAMIGPANPAEAAPAGDVGWEHGFVVRSLTLEAGATSRRHRRA